MATSLVSIVGVVQHDALGYIGRNEFNFQPPANIAGKLCYLEIKGFHFSPATNPSTLLETDFYTLRMNWSTPLTTMTVSIGINDSITKPGTILATSTPLGNFSAVGPCLVNIPSGPQLVTVQIEGSRGVLTAAPTTPSNIIILMSIVEANSRSAPL